MTELLITCKYVSVFLAENNYLVLWLDPIQLTKLTHEFCGLLKSKISFCYYVCDQCRKKLFHK